MGWWLIVPIVLFLACINAVVQPARQAAIPNLVPSGQVGKANAMVAATTMLTGALGFAIAGGLLALFPKRTDLLFIVDGATFALGAAVILGIPNLGGSMSTSVSGAIRRSWAVVEARSHLVVGALAAFLITISFPALVALAYKTSSQGGQNYSVFELISSVGIFGGSRLLSRFAAIGNMRTVGVGLLVTGAFSVVIAMSTMTAGSAIVIIGTALFIASFGNPIYTVANQTAILEAADPSNRGSIMSTRFGLVQTASIVGIAVGGLITKQFGPEAAYGVLGVGLVLLAMYAIAAGRSTINPILGADYEEATLRQAKT
jgi:predicted MFS family arabinose efflux permease